MTAVAAPSRSDAQTRWIHSAGTDTLIALAWVPFALVAAAVSGSSTALVVVVNITLLFSFTHQPLTLALVYGDPNQFAVARRIFTWSPLIFAVAVYVTFNVSFILLAVVGGAWNAIHTLFQRYGLIRIYGRKVGEDDGRLERVMLLAWLGLVAVWAAADAATPDRIVDSGLAGHNREALEFLADLRTPARLLLPVVAALAAFTTAQWLRRELNIEQPNRAKHLYVASTAVLFVVMIYAPIVGLVGYVGSHALEYFIIVYTNLKTRYQDHPEDQAPVAKAVRSRIGRPGFLAIYIAVISAIVFGLAASKNVTAYIVVFFTLGGLHVFYDGFIWKLKRHRVADSFDLPTPASS